MLSRDLWDRMAKRIRCAGFSSGPHRLILQIPNHELIDSSALGYVCLEKISDYQSEQICRTTILSTLKRNFGLTHTLT